MNLLSPPPPPSPSPAGPIHRGPLLAARCCLSVTSRLLCRCCTWTETTITAASRRPSTSTRCALFLAAGVPKAACHHDTDSSLYAARSVTSWVHMQDAVPTPPAPPRSCGRGFGPDRRRRQVLARAATITLTWCPSSSWQTATWSRWELSLGGRSSWYAACVYGARLTSVTNPHSTFGG